MSSLVKHTTQGNNTEWYTGRWSDRLQHSLWVRQGSRWTTNEVLPVQCRISSEGVQWIRGSVKKLEETQWQKQREITGGRTAQDQEHTGKPQWYNMTTWDISYWTYKGTNKLKPAGTADHQWSVTTPTDTHTHTREMRERERGREFSLDPFPLHVQAHVRLQPMSCDDLSELTCGSHVERLLEKLPSDQFCEFKRSMKEPTKVRSLAIF